jgi:hypothetical protein
MRATARLDSLAAPRTDQPKRKLGLRSDERKRQAVAKFIIRLAQEAGNLDAAALRDRAVAAVGGAAYRASSGISKPEIPTHLAE